MLIVKTLCIYREYMPKSSKTYVSYSSNPQVITPVRSGQGYVYEFPSKYQKDTYDIPPVRPLQGVSTNKTANSTERAQKIINFYQKFKSKMSSLISERKHVLIKCNYFFTECRNISELYLKLTKLLAAHQTQNSHLFSVF